MRGVEEISIGGDEEEGEISFSGNLSVDFSVVASIFLTSVKFATAASLEGTLTVRDVDWNLSLII